MRAHIAEAGRPAEYQRTRFDEIVQRHDRYMGEGRAYRLRAAFDQDLIRNQFRDLEQFGFRSKRCA